jgi:hypothetical protein
MSGTTLKEIKEVHDGLHDDLQDMLYGASALQGLMAEIAEGGRNDPPSLHAAHFIAQQVAGLACDVLNKYLDASNALAGLPAD